MDNETRKMWTSSIVECVISDFIMNNGIHSLNKLVGETYDIPVETKAGTETISVTISKEDIEQYLA